MKCFLFILSFFIHFKSINAQQLFPRYEQENENKILISLCDDEVY